MATTAKATPTEKASVGPRQDAYWGILASVSAILTCLTWPTTLAYAVPGLDQVMGVLSAALPLPSLPGWLFALVTVAGLALSSAVLPAVLPGRGRAVHTAPAWTALVAVPGAVAVWPWLPLLPATWAAPGAVVLSGIVAVGCALRRLPVVARERERANLPPPAPLIPAALGASTAALTVGAWFLAPDELLTSGWPLALVLTSSWAAVQWLKWVADREQYQSEVPLLLALPTLCLGAATHHVLPWLAGVLLLGHWLAGGGAIVAILSLAAAALATIALMLFDQYAVASFLLFALAMAVVVYAAAPHLCVGAIRALCTATPGHLFWGLAAARIDRSFRVRGLSAHVTRNPWRCWSRGPQTVRFTMRVPPEHGDKLVSTKLADALRAAKLRRARELPGHRAGEKLIELPLPKLHWRKVDPLAALQRLRPLAPHQAPTFPLGLDARGKQCWVSMVDRGTLVVAGAPSSGRSTYLLNCIAAARRQGIAATAIIPLAPDVAQRARELGAQVVTGAQQGIDVLRDAASSLTSLQSSTRRLIVVDGYGAIGIHAKSAKIDLSTPVETLADSGPRAGIYMILGVNRAGTLPAEHWKTLQDLSLRVALHISQSASTPLIDDPETETLIPGGDALFYDPTKQRPERVLLPGPLPPVQASAPARTRPPPRPASPVQEASSR